MLLLTGGVFANDIAENKNQSEDLTKEKEKVMIYCCTATLTYNGQYYDHQESCSTTPNGSDMNTSPNCREAKRKLLARNPQVLAP